MGKQDKKISLVIFLIFIALLVFLIVKFIFTPVSPPSPSPSSPHPPSSPTLKPKEYTEDFEPTGYFYTVWGVDKKNVFFGGSGGTILKYDGKKIVKYRVPTKETVYRIRGTSINNICAVCSGGIVLHFDGQRWKKMKVISEEPDLMALWVFPKAIMVGGEHGTFYKYDGTWHKIPVEKKYAIWNMWGFSEQDVYVLGGRRGYISHFDGKDLKYIKMPPKYFNTCGYCIWGDREEGKNVVYISGNGNSFLRYDGSGWTDFNVNVNVPENFFYGIFGLREKGATTIYLTYLSGIIKWHNGVTEVKYKNSGDDINEIWFYDKDFGFAVGSGSILKLQNGKWVRYHFGNPKKKKLPNKNVYHIRKGNSPIIYFKKGKWYVERKLCGNTLSGVWGKSTKSIYAVGYNGIIYHYDGKTWTKQKSPVKTELFRVRGYDDKNVFACGAGSVILKWNGRSWKKMKTPTEEAYFTSIWVIKPNLAYVVGYGGIILKFDGKMWQWDISPEKIDHLNLSEVWATDENHIFVSGDKGLILFYNGKEWHKIPTTFKGPIISIWGSSPNDVYFGTALGKVLHYDGKKVDIQDTGIVDCITGLWGFSSTDIYGVSGGGRGPIIHFDGKKWQEVAEADDGYLWDIWGFPEEEVIIVGTSD